jgi:ABC-type amino acid transport substrate-binding protein
MNRNTTRGLLAAFITTIALLSSIPALADMEKIRKIGLLTVAVYDDYAPYSGKPGGIDHDLAAALAKHLNLKLSLLPFPAGENIDDDLRNMVWKGHYLGFGPADVMLHVPVERTVMSKNDQVEIFAPYYRDTVKLVRSLKALPELRGAESLEGKKIGAEKVSISSMVLMGDPALRDGVNIYLSAIEALQKLKAGELDAVMATRAEIESVMRDDPGFEMTDAPFTRLPRNGWVIGMAVKKDNTELALLLQKAVNDMFESGEMNTLFAKHGVRSIKP